MRELRTGRMLTAALAAAAGAMAALATTSSVSAQEVLPLANFAHLPQMRSVAISPNGRFVAAIVANKDHPAIATFDLNNQA